MFKANDISPLNFDEAFVAEIASATRSYQNTRFDRDDFFRSGRLMAGGAAIPTVLSVTFMCLVAHVNLLTVTAYASLSAAAFIVVGCVWYVLGMRLATAVPQEIRNLLATYQEVLHKARLFDQLLDRVQEIEHLAGPKSCISRSKLEKMERRRADILSDFQIVQAKFRAYTLSHRLETTRMELRTLAEA